MKKFMVILAAIAMVGAFTATSIAAEWNFYGSARMTTFSYNKSKEAVGELFDDTDTTWTNQTNARIGANVKASDAVSGRFEYGYGASPSLRILWGEYNFGSGSLGVGQHYTPMDTLISTSVADFPTNFHSTDPVPDGDASNLQIGSFYEGRLPMIQLKFGGLKLAFIKPSTVGPQRLNLAGDGLENDSRDSDIDTTLPKIEVAYDFKGDMFSVRPYAGYNSVNFTNPLTDTDVSVDAYIIGATASVNFGPMYVKGNIFVSQNEGNFGRSNNVVFDRAVVSRTTTDIEDASGWGGIILAGFKMSDMFNFEAGYSMDHGEVDVAPGVTGENSPSQWYVNCTITLAPGVTITPEVGMTDFGDVEVTGSASEDQGDCTYFGAKWQINF